MLNDGQILHERYEIISMIGQGGMSYVYRANDLKMGRTVALKVLKEEYCDDEEFIRKFQNEAQAAAKLNHPNIVAAYDVLDDEVNRLHYIVMELVEGITLKNYIQRRGRLDSEETIAIALQVIAGIEQAHKMGIIHRDIKPQNMIVTADGTVKVADFGIARAATQQTVNATVMGSVHYISPEQARSGVSDQRSDIYSFGCTMYEMLTGRVPYEGETSVSVVFAHLQNDVPLVHDIVPEVYPALDKAVFKAMQKKSDLRYQDIAELGRDLDNALTDHEGSFIDDVVEVREPVVRTRAEKIRDWIGHAYRVLAVLIGIVIIGLLVFILHSVYLFLKDGSTPIETTYQMIETTAPSTEVQTEVNITISALNNLLPEIIGRSVSDAEDYLSEYRILIRVKEEDFSERYGEGMIISYPARDYAPGDIIDVAVSRGSRIIDFYDPAKPEELDSLHAMEAAVLEKQLTDRNVEFTRTEVYSDTVPIGYVVGTSKPSSAGSGTLEIAVSKGKESDYAHVPAVTLMTEEQAEALIRAAGLTVGNVKYTPDALIPTGYCITQDVPENTELFKGSVVGFTVSTGVDGETGIKQMTVPGPETTAAEIDTEEHWYGSLNTAVRVGGTPGPGIDQTMVISIRLRQYADGEEHYSMLQEARSYETGSELQLIYTAIPGESGVPYGTVEVVEASTDSVLASYDVVFSPRS